VKRVIANGKLFEMDDLVKGGKSAGSTAVTGSH
jgi:hypothetical protein